MRVRSDVKDIKLGGGNRQQDRVTIDERPSGKAKERAGSSDGFLLERVFRKSSYCWPSVKKEKRRRKNGGGTRSGSPSRPITVTHTQCIQESVGPCLHNPASVTTVYAGGARSSSSRSKHLSLSLSVVRSFVTRQSHNVPALSSHARVDRIGKHILVCSSPPSPRYSRSLIFVTVIVNAVNASTRARMKLVSVRAMLAG